MPKPKVPLQMAIDPTDKALIRQLARSEGRTMTRFVLRLVEAEAARIEAGGIPVPSRPWEHKSGPQP